MSLFNDLTEIFTQVDDLEHSFFHDDVDNWRGGELTIDVKQLLSNDGDDHSDVIELSKGISYANVDGYGGEEQGRDYYSVYKFTRGDEEVAIKFYGWYASHYGSEYEGYSLVKPVEKTVVVWE